MTQTPTMSTDDTNDDSEQTTIDRGNVSVTGGVDLTDEPGTSYFTPGKHGQKNGETVAGSSREDVEAGEMTVTGVPDPSDLPECLGGVKVSAILSDDELEQWHDMTTKRKRTAVVMALYPDKTKAAVGEIAETSATMVRSVGLETADVVRALANEFHDGDPPSDKHWREAELPFGELNDQRQEAIDGIALCHDANQPEQARVSGTSRPTIRLVDAAYDNLIQKRREAFQNGEAETVIEGVDVTDYGFPEPDPDAVPVPDPQEDDQMPAPTTDMDEDEQDADHAPEDMSEGADARPGDVAQGDAQERVEDAIFAARFIERTHDDVAGEVAGELRRILEGESEVER